MAINRDTYIYVVNQTLESEMILPAGLSKKLAEEQIFVSVRGDSIRIAPHLYNDHADVDRLFEALTRLL